jgi:dipeptidyl aminopeptidase/acylaminoacyl peptidase
MAWLYVLEEGKAARQITDGTYTVSSLSNRSWQGDQIVFVGDRTGESFLCRVSVDGGEVEAVSGGGQVFTSLALGGSRVVMHSNSPSSPSDLVMVDLESGDQLQVTAYNEALLEKCPAASLEKVTFVREGTEIQVRVLFPVDFDELKTYPLVLDIHGGPNGRFSDSFDITHQVLIGAGYIVLTVNPRGSSSYGPDFMKAVLRDWGGEDFLDLMAAMDRRLVMWMFCSNIHR